MKWLALIILLVACGGDDDDGTTADAAGPPVVDASPPADAAAMSDACVVTQVQNLVNGGFDGDSSAWAFPSGQKAGEIIIPGAQFGIADADMPSPPNMGVFGGVADGVPQQAFKSVAQTVNIPEGATSMVFSGFIIVSTNEPLPGGFDNIEFDLIDTGTGLPIEILAQFSDDDDPPGALAFVPFSHTVQADSSRWAGVPTLFQVVSQVDANLSTDFLVDSMALTSETPCP
jgi:hypothetical protein